ncbi:MAG: TonB-dependent receptor [Bacteroides sp.]|nr:TonB-dependent receptor [Bacteroides sp.]
MKQVNLRIYQTILTLIMGLFLSVGAYAQNITVKGHVKDAFGGVIGANVVEKGNPTNGTITDMDGNFTLSVPQGATLVVSFIGYKTEEIAAAPSVVVELKDDAELLSEVVVIGYGVVKKNDATGSVTAIKPDKISKGMTTNAQDMMQGKIAGVSVISDGGTPGGSSTIRIRGGASLNASNDPLIVIDGLAMDNAGVQGLSNPLAMVNPNDIETFTVLKDASATAIYGSRASNGVIIITTKKGAAGSKPKVTYDGNMSVGVIRSTLDVMTGDEFRSYLAGVYGGEENLPAALGTANTDWQSEIYRPAVSHDHNVTVTGGLKNMPYRVSFGYTNQNGIVKTSNFERYTVSANVAPTFFEEHLKFNVNAKVMVANNRYADGGAIGAAVAMDPTRPIYDDSEVGEVFGGYWQYSQNSEYKDDNWLYTKNTNATQNPVALLNLKNDKATSKSYVGNIEADYKFHFFPDLRIHANLGADYSEGEQTTVISPYSHSNHYYGWDGASYSYKYNLSGNAYLQYIKELDNHYIDVMVGAEEQHFHRTGYSVGQGTNQKTGEAYNPTLRELDAWGYHSTLVSFFGRVNYTLMDRYLLTFTIRRDGTSRFSEDNRWSTFPSVALGWKVKEESFLKDVDILSDLKLRLGWGVTGQQNLGEDKDFPFMALYSGNRNGAYYPLGGEYSNLQRPEAYNKNLKWEQTTTWNAGLDYGFLNGRINGSVDFYYRETKDLINTLKIPTLLNFNSRLMSNIGSLENIGVEFTINAKPIVTKDFTWDIGYNVTWNDNEITKLTSNDNPSYYVPTGGISKGTGATIQAQKVGYPINSFYVYQQVYDVDGKPIENTFVDRNGDGIINSSDRYIYKKPSADVLMGMTSKMVWKNWDFSFALRASFNNYVYNDVLAGNAYVGTSIYANKAYGNRPLAAIKLDFKGEGDYYMSDYFVQNASFLRCDNITLGYSFKNLFKTNGYEGTSGRIYATVQNPFVITKYDGLDPEVSSGIDNNIYPRPMTFLLGLSLQF